MTNLSISPLLDYLLQSGNNPVAAVQVKCRNIISRDGYLYDRDFNHMLDLKGVFSEKHISKFDTNILDQRDVAVTQQCYGCTAGSGSSCLAMSLKKIL